MYPYWAKGYYGEITIVNNYQCQTPKIYSLGLVLSHAYGNGDLFLKEKFDSNADPANYLKFRLVRDGSYYYIDIYFHNANYSHPSGQDPYYIRAINYTSSATIANLVPGVPKFYSATDTLNEDEILCISIDGSTEEAIYSGYRNRKNYWGCLPTGFTNVNWDLNNLEPGRCISDGYANWNKAANAPFNGGNGTADTGTSKFAGTCYCIQDGLLAAGSYARKQIAISHTAGNMYVRCFYNNQWFDWHEVALYFYRYTTAGYNPSGSEGSAINFFKYGHLVILDYELNINYSDSSEVLISDGLPLNADNIWGGTGVVKTFIVTGTSTYNTVTIALYLKNSTTYSGKSKLTGIAFKDGVRVSGYYTTHLYSISYLTNYLWYA